MQLVVPSAVSMADSMLISVCTANFQISFLFMVRDKKMSKNLQISKIIPTFATHL